MPVRKVTDPSVLQQLNGPIAPNPMFPGQLQGQGLNNKGQDIHNRKDEATLPYDVRSASARASSAELQLRQDRIAAGLDPDTGKPIAQSNDPNGGPSGQDFLKTLPAAEQRLVKAMADGRLVPPTGRAAASPYWQKLLGQTLQYDPSFDAIDYGARYNTRKDFTSGQSSRNIKALNTAIGHVSQLADQISGTASHGGFPFATTVNRIENAYERGRGDPGITKFAQTAGAVSSELTQVFRGTGGAEADVQRYLSELDPNASEDQKKAAVGNILGLLKSRLDAINDQYAKGMGTAAGGLDVLDPHSKEALKKYLPGFAAQQPKAPPAAPPPNNPPTGPAFVPTPTGSTDGNLRSSTDGYNDKPDPESAAFWDDAVHRQVPYRTALRQWQSDIKARGLQSVIPPDPGQYHKAADYIRKYPDIEYHPFQSTIHTPLGFGGRVSNAISSSAPGAFAGHFFNDATAGAPEALAGDQGAYFDAVSRQEHSTASALGDIGGTVAGAVGTNKALSPLLKRAPGTLGAMLNASKLPTELAPGVAAARQGLTSDMLFGGASGAIQNPDHPILGGLGGAAAMGGGNLFGRYTLGPALGYAAETTPGQIVVNSALRGGTKLKDLFSGTATTPPTFSPPAALEPGQRMLVKQSGKTLGDITGRLTDARDLELPFALADAHPKLRALTGSAVRKSPDVRTLAEDIIGPRQRGQAERAIGLIDQHLAPVGDVPTMTAEALAQAHSKSAPFYARAKSKPAPNLANEPALSGVLSRPSAETALRRGYRIALDEGANPAELSFATGPKGETVINGNPTWQTIHYVRRGLDEEISGAIDPVTGKVKPGMSDTQGAMIRLRGDLDKEIGRLNPAFKHADTVFADYAGQGTAAERGSAATGVRVTPERAARAVTNAGDNLPFFQRGYASNLADTVERTRLARDPYETIYGSPAQQAKMGIIFPEGAGTFGRARGLESDMSKTAYETLGGSPTQMRAEADAVFGNPMMDAATEIGTPLLTGGIPGPKTLGRIALKLGDIGNLGIRGTKAKADQLGPLLLNTDPAANLATLSDLIQQSLARQRYVNSSRTLGGLIGAPLTYGALNR